MDGSRWAELAQALLLGSRALRKRIARLTGQHDLTDTEFLVLCCCRREGGEIPQALIADSLGLSPAQVSVITEKLRTRELVLVQRGKTDRRKQFCVLTEQGERLERHLAQQLREELPQSGIRIGAVDLDQLLSLLDALVSKPTEDDSREREAA